MLKRLATVLGGMVLALVAPSHVARADENGIKIGDGRLHPYFDLETRYDTVAQLDPNTGQGVPDLIWHFRPGLKLDVPSPTLSFNLSGAVEYLLYTGLNNSNAHLLDRLQAEGALDIGILRGSVVSFDINDHFNRSDQTTDVGLTFGVLSLYNDLGVTSTIAPGGGSLTITPGYHLTIENFSSLFNLTGGTGTTDPGTLNYLNHQIVLENRWRFLPKTAVLLDGEYDFRTYTNGVNTGIQYFKATTGVAGLITPHISTIARVGWGMDLTTHSFSSVIGQLEGSYLPNETSSIRLGVLRTFQPVQAPFTTYEDDRGYLEGRVLLFERLTLHVFGSVDYLGFKGTQTRNDLVFSIDGGADLETFRWLIVSLGDSFITRSSDDHSTSTLNYSGDQVYLRVTFIY
jgi:hypothetical protein